MRFEPALVLKGATSLTKASRPQNLKLYNRVEGEGRTNAPKTVKFVVDYTSVYNRLLSKHG